MSKFLFRNATESDLSAIVAMLADDELGQLREAPANPLDARYVAAFKAIDRDPNQELIVIEESGALVACFQLTFIPGLSRLGLWRGQIESVRVASGSRGKGLGREMLAWAIEECRRRGCGLVQLTSDKSCKETFGFYESLGFRASHEGMKLEF